MAGAGSMAAMQEAMAANPEVALKLQAPDSDESLAMKKIVLNMMVAAFMKFDTDGSNSLTAAEARAIFTRPGGGNPLSEADADALIGAFDKDGSGTLDFYEFAAFLTPTGLQANVNMQAFNELVRMKKDGSFAAFVEKTKANPDAFGKKTA